MLTIAEMPSAWLIRSEEEDSGPREGSIDEQSGQQSECEGEQRRPFAQPSASGWLIAVD